jgi:hypothetical protein
MARTLNIALGTAMTVALMVTALWAWRLPPELGLQGAVERAGEPYMAKLGIRSLSLALAAAAQVILLTFVIARVYPPRLSDRVLGIGLAITGVAALGTAIVLALLSR